MAKTLYETGAHEISAICETLGISRSTFYRYLALPYAAKPALPDERN